MGLSLSDCPPVLDFGDLERCSPYWKQSGWAFLSFSDCSCSQIIQSADTRETLLFRAYTQVTTQVMTQVSAQGEEIETSIEQKIMDFCKEPKSTKEIAAMLGYKERKSAARYIRPLLEKGRIAMTIPDKPNSQNQKYITIK